ncbi:hypothetical protein [uncultured Campylobacter sp.]|uniref:hypothetical protein n=1 Tax=uncultured Campylobacter sp. TaxID=218934 RepID=UPI0026209939|nr:hypothetical protein [uncultured Campylobacter sp.]
MKKLVILLFTPLFCFGNDVNIDDVKDWIAAGQYSRICKDNVRKLFVEQKNSTVANIYAKACLKLDKINELIIPITMLYEDRASRENAAIYATILYQKKLLYFAIIDNYDISYIQTPKIEYILSYIFDKFVAKEYELKENRYHFILNDDLRCELFIEDDSGIKKLKLEIYDNDRLVSTKVYW